MKINVVGPWIAIAVLSLIVVMGGFLRAQPRLVIVDMARVIQRPSEMLSHSRLSQPAQQKIMQRYAALLPEVIAEYAAAHHVTVLSGKVLAGGAKNDLSDVIVEQTVSRLKHETM